MHESIIRVPDSRHPIIVEPRRDHVVLTAKGRVVAETRRALSLREADLPSVLYIPRRDVDMSALRPSGTSRYCPYKGDAAFFGIVADADFTPDCAWTYGMPHWAVCEIEDHVAFDPHSVEIVEAVGG